MSLCPVRFDAFFSRRQRNRPVTAHLQVFVQGLHRLVVEGVFCALFLLRPDHGFVRIGKTHAAEIRHRVRFEPDHIVEYPKAKILHDRADTVNIVIRTDNPDGPIFLEYPACSV